MFSIFPPNLTTKSISHFAQGNRPRGTGYSAAKVRETAEKRESQSACFAILDKDIQAYREKNGSAANLDGWLRDFHKEYDDFWFNSNRIRLRETFANHWNRATGEQVAVDKTAEVVVAKTAAAANLLDGFEEESTSSGVLPAVTANAQNS